MLVNKTYEDNSIVTFKLINGDEIVTKVIYENDNNFEISKPTTVIPQQQGIGLMQSLFTGDMTNGNDTSINIQKSHIMMHTLTDANIKAHYIQVTTGIETVAKPPGIITS